MMKHLACFFNGELSSSARYGWLGRERAGASRAEAAGAGAARQAPRPELQVPPGRPSDRCSDGWARL